MVCGKRASIFKALCKDYKNNKRQNMGLVSILKNMLVWVSKRERLKKGIVPRRLYFVPSFLLAVFMLKGRNNGLSLHPITHFLKLIQAAVILLQVMVLRQINVYIFI
jgi:hypothetical protein